MSGFLALLDDVAAIAKLAAAQLDDIAAQSAKAGAKAAGVVIDDAAVTPKYVVGLPAARELPIVWQIARASLFNKLVILTPIALLLATFAPWALAPLLMLGGLYLCFEGAEKVYHFFVPHEPASGPQKAEVLDAAHLEKTRVAGAIKTDFILSAEIMVISLSQIDSDSFLTRVLTLIVIAVVITVAVYGAVAILVKADDVGLRLARPERSEGVRALGRGIVAAMPGVMAFISFIGTAAMLWVGGNILVHNLHETGWWNLPYETIKAAAYAVSGAVPVATGLVTWLVTAFLDGILGIVVGLALIPVATKVIGPLVARATGKEAAAH